MIPPAWQVLLAAMLEAVWLVDPLTLRIVAANPAACTLLDLTAEELVGKPVIELTATPEDQFFWEDVAAGLSSQIHSETMVRSNLGVPIAVERRVSRVPLDAGNSLFLVSLRDLRQQRRVEESHERLMAELRATLESTADGILVTDLSGSVRNYNRHFARLWDMPEELLLQRNDRALYQYVDRLKQDHLRGTDRIDKVLFDSKIHLVHQALGLHTSRARVQGSRLKGSREIRIASLFRVAPLEFLRMIFVHELAHLRVREHDKAFYQLCLHVEPTYHQLEFDVRLYLTHLDLGGDRVWGETQSDALSK